MSSTLDLKQAALEIPATLSHADIIRHVVALIRAASTQTTLIVHGLNTHLDVAKITSGLALAAVVAPEQKQNPVFPSEKTAREKKEFEKNKFEAKKLEQSHANSFAPPTPAPKI